MRGKRGGFDFGMKEFVREDNGRRIECGVGVLNDVDELRRKRRNVWRKKKGRNGGNKGKLCVGRLERKICNMREDFEWKRGMRIVCEYDVICVERVKMKGMEKVWGRKVKEV